MHRVLAFYLLAFVSAAHAQTDCADIANAMLPDVAITSAQAVATPTPHCKVDGRIGGKIGFSVWLPDEWNGRFVMGGQGGFVMPNDNQALTYTPDLLARGFATASTDTGHRAQTPVDGSWALDDMEAIVNYGHLGMHRAVVSAKSLIGEYYASHPEKSFFVGCSNGGRQALMEAQRYPGDFDAIVAGAPALNFEGITAQFVSITQKMFPNPDDLTRALVTPESRRILRQAILDACDAGDGLSDGILNDPTECSFDPASLTCGADETESCIPADQVAAIETVYDGPRDDDGSLFFGFPFGAEDVEANGWGSWLAGGNPGPIPNAAYGFGMGVMRNFVHHDPTWSYVGYDWNNFEGEFSPVVSSLVANDPDLSEFRGQGGKLLLFHGWADVALTAHMSTDYLDQVYAADPAARDDVRLFMMPGVLHCFGGAGPSLVDWLSEIEQWHDSGDAPSEVAASYPGKAGSRKLCAWPQQAAYTGGEAESADSYRCE